MFCFPNTFGRRERLEGAADRTGVATERIGRWRRRNRETMPPVLGVEQAGVREASAVSSDEVHREAKVVPVCEWEGHDVERTTQTLSANYSEGQDNLSVSITLPVNDGEDCRSVATLTLPVNDDDDCRSVATLTLPVDDDEECMSVATLILPLNDGEDCRSVATLTLPVNDSKDCKSVTTLTLPVNDSEDSRGVATLTLSLNDCEDCKSVATLTNPLPLNDSEDCRSVATLTIPLTDSEDCKSVATLINPVNDREDSRGVATLTLPLNDSKDNRSVATLPLPPSESKVKPPLSPSLGGTRFKLVREGDIQVCYLNRERTVVSKILSSKFLRRWETHRLYLNDACISSKTPNGVFDVSVTYSSMEEVYVVTRWDAGHKFCIRVVIEDGSLLLQASSSYIRDQWYHSILWKKNIFKYRNILKPSSRPEVVLKELKNLVRYATTNPLHDESVIGVPIQIVSDLLAPKETARRCRSVSGDMISTMAPLLENTTPSPEMCRFFSDHCVNYPRSAVVSDTLTPVVQRIMIHNVDFGKYPNMRQFVQDYIKALYQQNGGEEVVRKFVTSIHGPGSICPHLRVLPNLVSACLAAVSSVFEDTYLTQTEDQEQETNMTLQCFMSVILYISQYEDWRPELAQLLQPVPFPPKALSNKLFLSNIVPVMKLIVADPKCDVQDIVLGVRDGRPSWLHVFCPSENRVVVDDGSVWCLMVERLLACCSRRKLFLSLLVTQLGACFLLALRGHSAAQQALCLMLEWELVEQEDQKMQIVTTLQGTPSGRERYTELCKRQLHLKELQQKGGPRKLTLPSRSTDDDIARLLSCGSFGNLACLSLAFTHVTSSVASELIKLPALRYLNLWATQFGDPGLLMISEHLHKLQVLNLCETPVTDTGIAALSAMTNLRKLNLNSTKLTAQTFESLKKKLPDLVEFDVRYTDAW